MRRVESDEEDIYGWVIDGTRSGTESDARMGPHSVLVGGPSSETIR